MTRNRALALSIAGLVALAVSVWILFVSAANLKQQRYRQTTATEYALTLTRVASAVATTDPLVREGLFRSDEIAKLVAMGDIQSSQLAPARQSRWIEQPYATETDSGADQLVRQWSSLRSALVAMNGDSVSPAGIEQSVDGKSPSAVFLRYSRSFEQVFEAITKDTLSVDLLRKVSEVNSDLVSIGFLIDHSNSAEFVDSINQAFGQLQQHVGELQALSLRGDGASLLGYESNRLLQKFIQNTNQLQSQALLASVKPASGAVVNEDKNTDLQRQILTAMNQGDAYRRTLDNVIHHYRRSVLGALVGVCAALFLTALMARLFWRSKRPSEPQGSDTLELLIADIHELADGNLDTQVREVDGDSKHADQSRRIAQGVNYTGDMLRSMVALSRGVAGKTAGVAQQQRNIAEIQIQADLARRQHIAAMVEELNSRSESLKVLISQESNSTKDFVISQLDSQDKLNSANSALAGVSAQIELGASRIKRVVETVNELALMVESIKSVAERSSLHALNSSIQMSALSDGEPEESSQFVDEMQVVSRKLAASAADAQRLVGRLKADTQAAGLSLSGCASAIQDNASHASKLAKTLDQVRKHVDTLGSSHMLLIDELKRQQESLYHIAEKLCETHDVDAENNKLLVLMELTLDQQLMASKLEQSLSHYNFSRDEAIAR